MFGSKKTLRSLWSLGDAALSSLRSSPSANRNFTVHFVALVLLNSIFPSLISALSDFPALFASLTRENLHEGIEGKIELR